MAESCVFNTNNATFPDPRIKSCRDRCGRGNTIPTSVQCSCDQACLFLGDCCHDYRLLCTDNNATIKELTDQFEKYSPYARCENYNISIKSVQNTTSYKENMIYVVTRCTPILDDSESSSCLNNKGKSHFLSNAIPVLWRGILFANIYCAQCHGIPLHEVQPIAAHAAQQSSESLTQDHYFQHLLGRQIYDDTPIIIQETSTFYPFRYNVPCIEVLPGFVSCADIYLREKCFGYFANGSTTTSSASVIYHNGTCVNSTGLTNITRDCPSSFDISKLHTNHTVFQIGLLLVTTPPLFNANPISFPCGHVEKYGMKNGNCLRSRCLQGAVEIRGDCVPFGNAYGFKDTAIYPAKPSVNMLEPFVIIFLESEMDLMDILTEYQVIERLTPKGEFFLYETCPQKVFGLYIPFTRYMYDSIPYRLKYQDIQWEIMSCIAIPIDAYVFWDVYDFLHTPRVGELLIAYPDMSIRVINHSPLQGVTCSPTTVPAVDTQYARGFIHLSGQALVNIKREQQILYFRFDLDALFISVTKTTFYKRNVKTDVWVLICVSPTFMQKKMPGVVMMEDKCHVSYYLSRSICPPGTINDLPINIGDTLELDAYICHNTSWGSRALKHVSTNLSECANRKPNTGEFYVNSQQFLFCSKVYHI